jgi:signal peptidase I
VLVFSPVIALLGLALTTLFTHFVLFVVGGRNASLGETLECVGYASAPTLFGVVPVAGVIVGHIWQLVVLGVALVRVHGTSALRAALAVIFGSTNIVFAGLVLRTFAYEAFKIPSGGMRPTLAVNDHIFANKLAYGPQIPFTRRRLFRKPPVYGDPAVFVSPVNPNEDFVKRVIGLGGDVVEVDGGHPIVNGWRVPSCRVGGFDLHEPGDASAHHGELDVEFLGGRAYLTFYEEDHFEGRQGPYEVAQGEAFVLGDNRNNSLDSRAWRAGRGAGVPYDNFKGRATLIWMSFREDETVDWSRTLMDLSAAPRLPQPASSELSSALAKCLEFRPAVTMPLSRTDRR